MVTQHQPTIFKADLVAAVSSYEDGDMKFGQVSDDEVIKNRQLFLSRVGLSLDRTVLVKLDYGQSRFTTYREVYEKDAAVGMRSTEGAYADGLVTRESIALFLPLADCIGAILYAPAHKILMVSHLGRHNLEQNGAFESVRFLRENYNVPPEDLLVWLSPAAGADNYPLYAFDGRGMKEVAIEQLASSGVQSLNIEDMPIDTTKSNDYFSHSEFLKSRRAQDGRFAIVAMMVEQGEPAA